jgi:hypothetical protein
MTTAALRIAAEATAVGYRREVVEPESAVVRLLHHFLVLSVSSLYAGLDIHWPGVPGIVFVSQNVTEADLRGW